ncbi:hypothetical protein F5I97DRAFT_344769 [Phlebopus sp. FC_14]|nr:hypothetical protein F5I97DRAFT_344769 [Phlebopus sp. FC_14]
MTTCTSGLITWNYSGQEAEVELSVTNFGVYQDQQRFALGFILAKRQNTAGQMVDQVLADTNATSGSWTWSSVNLPEGWYQAEAAMSDFATSSPQFFIANGSDVSCLSGNLSLSSGTSSSPKSNIGAIIGGVIGGVVGLALVALALTLWFRRRRVPARGHDSRSTNVGRWGSLTSNSSNINAGGNSRNLTNQHYRAHSQSAGEMVPVIAGDKASATTTRGGSDEDATTMGEEKAVTPSSPPGMNPFEALDTPAPYNRRASTYSLQSPSVLADSSRSVRASNQSLEQQAHRIRSSMESSLYLRTERLSMPVLPPLSLPRTPTSPVRSTTRDEYPLSPVTPLPVNRSSSLGGSSGTRRTPRKPVPQYDAAELRQDSAQDTQSTFTATGESSHSHETRGVPELSHKASFGSHRPVHYLIPDMPLPERE